MEGTSQSDTVLEVCSVDLEFAGPWLDVILLRFSEAQ